MKYSCLNIHYIPMKYRYFSFLSDFSLHLWFFSFSELCFHHSGTTSLLKDKAGCLECHIAFKQSKLGNEKQYILLALLFELI